MATNYVDRIEPALMRKGRIDRPVPLVYPDRESRRCTLGKYLEALRQKDKKEKWTRWAALLLQEELGDKRIAATDYWPWKAFDTLCKEATRDLERLSREGLKKAQRDRRALQLIEQAMTRGRAEVSMTVYDSRHSALSTSAELREEFLQYRLAGAEDVVALVNQLFMDLRVGAPADFDRWNHPGTPAGKLLLYKKASDLLRLALGDKPLKKLEEIAGIRSWEALELSVEE